ncbi:MAG: alpha/beta hydrolase [Chloroflexi bacterium HGW-Chloroflexi-6]|nr:MAG: alpha/beta hydrolase [Chloroflexi bacterium HGW-Chloroflexi-6]
MSIQSELLYFMMKNRHLFRLRLKQETWDENTSIPAFRTLCEESNRKMEDKLPAGLKVEAFKLAEMNAEWLIPAGANKNKVIFYTIGGGYISGTCNDHRTLVAKVAQASGITVLMFDHRLAPENPYPAALDDSVTAYRWLLEQGTLPENIVIMGESAGGGLCLATLLAVRDQGLPLPAGAVALSPWTDLTLSGESYRTRARVCISPPGMSQVCSKYYIGEHDATDPWISPLYGDLRGLPPLFINVGDYETMRDDSVRFAAKAKTAGVDTTLVVGEKMIHCYPLMAGMFPEATQALNEVCRFIRKQLQIV